MILPSTSATMKKNTKTHHPGVSGRLRRIEGRHNALVKELRAAFVHGDLTPDGYCAIEGVRILEEAIRSGLKFKAVFFRASAENRAERLLPQLAAYVETLLLPDKLFASAVPSETPQGVAALVRCKTFTLEDVLARAQAGAVAGGCWRTGPGESGHDPALGGGLRSRRRADGGRHGQSFQLKSHTRLGGIGVPASDGRDQAAGGSGPTARAWPAPDRNLITQGHAARQATLTGRLTVFIGSEGAGLPRELLSQMDETVAIPHSPNVESLNAGVAASIVLYEAARQRK